MKGVLPELIWTRRYKGHYNDFYYAGLARAFPCLEAMIRRSAIDELDLFDNATLLHFPGDCRHVLPISAPSPAPGCGDDPAAPGVHPRTLPARAASGGASDKRPSTLRRTQRAIYISGVP